VCHRYGEFVLHSLVNEREPRVTFTCLTGDKFPQPLAYAYLAAVRREFFRRYPLPMDKNTTLRCTYIALHDELHVSSARVCRVVSCRVLLATDMCVQLS
jgi:hypothetical protein